MNNYTSESLQIQSFFYSWLSSTQEIKQQTNFDGQAPETNHKKQTTTSSCQAISAVKVWWHQQLSKLKSPLNYQS